MGNELINYLSNGRIYGVFFLVGYGWFSLCISVMVWTGSSSGNGKVATAVTKYYDDIYFDSDSEDEDKAGK